MTTFAAPLKTGETTLGVQILDDLKRIVRAADAGSPRSKQKAIGPSEYGDACPRKLAYKMLGHPECNTQQDVWARVVGTAVHAWLAYAFGLNQELMPDGRPRYVMEQRVNIHPGLSGSVDLYDRLLRTVIDFKIPGLTTVRAARKNGGPGDLYVKQVHAYGVGYLNAGEHVEHVGVAMIPKAGVLNDAYIWTEPLDPAVVTAAAEKQAAALGMAAALDVEHHPERFLLIPARESHCNWCSWYMPGGNGASGCPGVA